MTRNDLLEVVNEAIEKNPTILQMNHRLEALEKRVDGMNHRLEALEKKVDAIKEDLHILGIRFDDLGGKMDKILDAMVPLLHKGERLEDLEDAFGNHATDLSITKKVLATHIADKKLHIH